MSLTREGESRSRLVELLDRTPQVAVRRLVTDPLSPNPLITDVTFDSRRVTLGSAFFCVRGDHDDGHDFASGAVRAGAAAIVVDHELAQLGHVAQVVVDGTRKAMAYLSSTFFDNPSHSMTVVGITGTNGKTTTAHIVSSALEFLGSRTGTIGTLSGAHTTPEAPDLQRRLAEFKHDGCTSIAMEVSSHALALDRVLGSRFRIAIFTNLGGDHRDLHGTTERYFAAKARLFEPDLSECGVVNIDDVHGRLLMHASSIPMFAFSLADASDLEFASFEHSFTWRGERVRVQLGGRFNVMNSLAAATALEVIGYAPADIVRAVSATTPVPGRFEQIVAGQDFLVVVDYAHTPEALREVLSSARGAAAGNRVIVVFGCGGDRDREKRPLMGRVAAMSCDSVVVTSDNPRSEDPLTIINDIIGGVPAEYRTSTVVEPDRHQAIAVALRAAGPGDVVVIAGKGHETTQTIQSTVSPFDDRIVARALLESMS